MKDYAERESRMSEFIYLLWQFIKRPKGKSDGFVRRSHRLRRAWNDNFGVYEFIVGDVVGST